jgi:hypothetical protein
MRSFTQTLADHPLSAARHCLFDTFAVTLYIWRPVSYVRNMWVSHAVMTCAHLGPIWISILGRYEFATRHKHCVWRLSVILHQHAGLLNTWETCATVVWTLDAHVSHEHRSWWQVSTIPPLSPQISDISRQAFGAVSRSLARKVIYASDRYLTQIMARVGL